MPHIPLKSFLSEEQAINTNVCIRSLLDVSRTGVSQFHFNELKWRKTCQVFFGVVKKSPRPRANMHRPGLLLVAVLVLCAVSIGDAAERKHHAEGRAAARLHFSPSCTKAVRRFKDVRVPKVAQDLTCCFRV